MATAQTTALAVERREAAGSREARRLRRTGRVPGILYGGGEEPVAFQVDARLLRQTLAHAGAVIELSVDGAGGTPVVVKELTRHPVNGETVHIDLLRVRLDQAIHSTVILELVGADDAPGVKEGGVLEQVTRELNIEALPGDIPDSIHYDVSGVQIGDTITLEAEEEIEEETERVAEGEVAEEAEEGAAEEPAAGATEGGAEGE